MSGSPGSTTSPFVDEQARPPRELVLGSVGGSPSGPSSVGDDRDLGAALVLLDLDAAAHLRERAAPFGFRASKISTTRGRPCVMSAPATPPVWNVRIVSCVPGSPIDCAAMMPTASPISHISPVARKMP